MSEKLTVEHHDWDDHQERCEHGVRWETRCARCDATKLPDNPVLEELRLAFNSDNHSLSACWDLIDGLESALQALRQPAGFEAGFEAGRDAAAKIAEECYPQDAAYDAPYKIAARSIATTIRALRPSGQDGQAEQKRKYIELTPPEIQSGVDRVKWAEGLIRQLPENHDGRNSWLLNYGSKAEQNAAHGHHCPGQRGEEVAGCWRVRCQLGKKCVVEQCDCSLSDTTNEYYCERKDGCRRQNAAQQEDDGFQGRAEEATLGVRLPAVAAPPAEHPDCQHYRAFFTKYALGSKLLPSCFGCGKAKPREEWAVTHAELPDIYLCRDCKPPSEQITEPCAVESSGNSANAKGAQVASPAGSTPSEQEDNPLVSVSYHGSTHTRHASQWLTLSRESWPTSEQEAVAWLYEFASGVGHRKLSFLPPTGNEAQNNCTAIPLYLHPARREDGIDKNEARLRWCYEESMQRWVTRHMTFEQWLDHVDALLTDWRQS